MKIEGKKKTTGKNNVEGKSRKRSIIMAALVLLLVGLAARAFRSNPVDAARQLRAQLSQDEDLSPEERQEIGKKLREQVRELTPEQRRQLMSDRQKEMAKEMERFFQLPAQEQQQELDKKIDQMVARMQKGGPGGGGPGSGGPGGPGFGGPGAFGPNPGQAGGNPGAPGGPGPFGGKGASPQQREERRQQMLDYSTPAFRAQMYEFRQMMQNRMQERGVQPPAFGAKRP